MKNHNSPDRGVQVLCTVVDCAVLYRCCAVECVVLCSVVVAVQCSAVQCSAVQCIALWSLVVLYCSTVGIFMSGRRGVVHAV